MITRRPFGVTSISASDSSVKGLRLLVLPFMRCNGDFTLWDEGFLLKVLAKFAEELAILVEASSIKQSDVSTCKNARSVLEIIEHSALTGTDVIADSTGLEDTTDSTGVEVTVDSIGVELTIEIVGVKIIVDSATSLMFDTSNRHSTSLLFPVLSFFLGVPEYPSSCQ